MKQNTSVKMEGFGKVSSRFKAMTLKGRKRLTVKVGFATPYAARIHEDLEMYHNPPTQAKYLEQPLRELQDAMGEVVVQNLINKESLETALIRAGNLLLEAALPLVPIDTGRLRRSGYVKVVSR